MYKRQAGLYGADLQGVDFGYANLTGAMLDYADLSCANLSRANLSDCSIVGTKLYKTNLCYARFDNVYLAETDFRSAITTYTDFTKAQKDEEFYVNHNL